MVTNMIKKSMNLFILIGKITFICLAVNFYAVVLKNAKEIINKLKLEMIFWTNFTKSEVPKLKKNSVLKEFLPNLGN